MSVNSKAKGAKGERELCKWWKSWTGFEFSRVPASGGLRWKKTDNITSDVICTDDRHGRRCPFSIECKNYKGLTFNDIIKGTKSDILKFWEQTCNDATRGNKVPILFMRENGMAKGIYFTVVNTQVAKLILLNNMLPKNYFKIHLETSEDIYVFNSNDLKAVDYSQFYKKVRKLLKLK